MVWRRMTGYVYRICAEDVVDEMKKIDFMEHENAALAHEHTQLRDCRILWSSGHLLDFLFSTQPNDGLESISVGTWHSTPCILPFILLRCGEEVIGVLFCDDTRSESFLAAGPTRGGLYASSAATLCRCCMQAASGPLYVGRK